MTEYRALQHSLALFDNVTIHKRDGFEGMPALAQVLSRAGMYQMSPLMARGPTDVC